MLRQMQQMRIRPIDGQAWITCWYPGTASELKEDLELTIGKEFEVQLVEDDLNELSDLLFGNSRN